MSGPRTNEGPPPGAERPAPAAAPPGPQGPSTWRDLAKRLGASAEGDPIGGFYPVGERLKLEAARALLAAANALENAPILDHPARIPTLQPPAAPSGGWAVVLVAGTAASVVLTVIPVPSLEDGETAAKALEARIPHATAVVVRHLGPR